MAVNIEQSQSSVKTIKTLPITAKETVQTKEAPISASKGSEDAEMAQFLSSLQETFDFKEVKETTSNQGVYKFDAETVTELLKGKVEGLNDTFNQVVQKIASNPSYYMADLCVNGQICPQKAQSFCQKEVSGLQQRSEALKAKYPETVTSSSTATNVAAETETPDADGFTTAHSDSYFATAATMGDLATNVGFIESQISLESAIQAAWGQEMNDRFTQLSTDSMNDVIDQYNKLQKKKHSHSIFGKITKSLGFVSMGLGSITMAFGGKPLLSAGVLSLGLTSAMGGFEKLTAVLAKEVFQAMGIPADVSRLLADALIVLAVVAVTAATGGAAMAGFVGCMLAPMTSIFQDAATVCSRIPGTDPMAWQYAFMIGGMVGCMAGSFAFGTALFAEAAVAEGGAVAAEASAGAEAGAATTTEASTMAEKASQAATYAYNAAKDSVTYLGDSLSYLTGASKTTMLYTVFGLDIATNATLAVFEALLAQNENEIVHTTRDLSNSEADLNLYNTILEQVSDTTSSTADFYNEQISDLGSSLLGALSAMSKPLKEVAEIMA